MDFEFNDGGRADAGYKGSTGDCVCRSIAIATETPYQTVYYLLIEAAKTERKKNRSHPRTGASRKASKKVMTLLGWTWVPVMSIGSGCTMHLRTDELPAGRLVLSLSRHYTAIIDGVIHDLEDCSRGGTRCVYGYFYKRFGKVD